MKLMLISDIHGSAHYLKRALEVYKKGHFDRLVILGDVLYHGPRNPLPEGYDPKAVAVMLNEMKDEIIAIGGNCDSQVDQMVLEFPVLQESSHILMEDGALYLCHGHKLIEDALPSLPKDTIICHGHTHIPRDEMVGGYRIFNPGSIALPKKDTMHGYGVYEGGNLVQKDLLA